MFVNFDDVFNNEDPKSQFNIPPRYIDFLNKSLPKGIKYILDKEGNCVISSDNDRIKIGGFSIVLNEKQLEIIGNNNKINDILNYAYNSQQSIEIKPLEEGFIKLNGEKFPIDRLEYNPLNPIKLVKGKFYIIPPKFNKKIELKLSNDKYSRKILISRIPNNSIDKLSFASEKEETLQFSCIIDQKTNEININISFNLRYAKEIKDIIESVSIYNSFVDGKGYIGENLFDFKVSNKKNKKYDENSIVFWEKVLKIENKLGIKFKPPKENLEYEEILEIEELYQSLILKRPFKDKNVISSINARWNANMSKHIGEKLFFQFVTTYSREIFGKTINLLAIAMVFNSKLANIEKKENNANIIFEDESEDKKRYTVVMFFKSNEELQKYKKQLNDMTIQIFKDAKNADEYLNDNKNK